MASQDDPATRADLFRKARAVNPGVDLGDLLPPPGSPSRFAVLVELVKIDLEQRARAGQPTRLEPYIRRFAADMAAAPIPIALLYEEYRVRHRFADAPPVAEYKARFPTRYEEFRRYVERHPVEPKPPPPSPPGTVDPAAVSPPVDLAGVTKTESIAPVPPPPDRAPADDEPDYKVLKVLGRGAYGKVFLAEAPGGVPVALKQILRGIDHPIGQSELEALEAIKQLSHPFLLQIHRFWIEGDQLYIAMDLADGSLADRVDACKEQGLPGVPAAELVPFFAEAAEALDYLHSKNVTHRDVKPQNLLSLKGHAKLADLGLARSHAHSIQMTTVRQETGTPLFMAPEVWRKKVSKHSDQYSLAASYVAARLGRALYETEFIDQLIVRHLEHTPNLDPLPKDEQRVLLRALAKKPEERFPSCSAFVAALQEVVFPPPRPSPWPRRAIIAGAVVVGCVLAYALFLLFAPKPEPSPLPPPPAAWKPPGWEPAAGAEAVEDLEGKRYFDRVERPAGGTALVAVLIPQRKPTDPATFYMLRDKVTNRVFAAVWGTDGGPAARRFRAKEWATNGNAPVPGAWKDGAIDPAIGKGIGTGGDMLDTPVVNVTAVEAALVAEDLGGRLPSHRQWVRATGANDDPPAKSPAGDLPFNLAKLALGKTRPQRIDLPTADEGLFHVRELISNGLEWTRDWTGGQEFDPFAAPKEVARLIVVGESWDSTHETTYEEIRNGRRRQSYDWHDTKKGIAFRVVLEPPR
jgi:hypothetical protein